MLAELSASPPEPRVRRVRLVRPPASPALPPLDFFDLLGGRLVDVVEGLAVDLRAEEVPLGRVDRALVVVVVAGGPLLPLLPVAVPTSLLT